jgi:hypothetical protein
LSNLELVPLEHIVFASHRLHPFPFTLNLYIENVIDLSSIPFMSKLYYTSLQENLISSSLISLLTLIRKQTLYTPYVAKKSSILV